ncbi:MAG: hypothetical protein NZ898_04775 [Myxococcota bacterium]|nr:hypothetical protein [Myxococcota bacterium]
MVRAVRSCGAARARYHRGVLVECTRCGAPLDVRQGESHVKCRYCEAVSRVRSLKTIAPQTPSDWKPPAVWQPTQGAHAGRSLEYHEANLAWQEVWAERARRNAKIAALGGLAPAVVAIVTAFVMFSRTHSCGETPLASRPPEHGVIQFETQGDGSAPAPRVVRGVIRPALDVEQLGWRSRCEGYVGESPTVRIQGRTRGVLVLEARAQQPTTIALLTPSGATHCVRATTASAGARLIALAEPGIHVVSVGALRAHHDVPFELVVRWAPIPRPPDPRTGLVVDAAPLLATVDPVAQASGSTSGPVWPAVDARDLDLQCLGHIGVVPHMVLRPTGPVHVEMTASIQGGDAALVAVMQDGSLQCDDDGGDGFDAKLSLFTSTPVAIFAGSVRDGESADVTLRWSAEPLTGEPDAATGLVLGDVGSVATLSDSDLERPRTVNGTTRTSLEARQIDSQCRGWVPRSPHVVVSLEQPREVELTTRSTGDTTLLVRLPDGRIACDDDSGSNRNARLRLELPAGPTRVWVGRFGVGAQVAFELAITPPGMRRR